MKGGEISEWWRRDRRMRAGCGEEAFACCAQQHWELKTREAILLTHVDSSGEEKEDNRGVRKMNGVKEEVI